ncbi:APC family permease [Streptomyces sp. NPDC004111]|uniref:APC family permease n=1 Tax=Streptomyces sp. NPDC004111 TaxID=3364690 RepID=UPI0036A54190
MDMSAGNRKSISLFALIMIGIGSIFGSGWLFGAGNAAKVAGPAAVVAWILGAIFMGLIAMSYGEVGAAYPIPGGMARFGAFSHGPVLGFITGWAVWLAVAALIPIESIATTQYMASWNFSWASGLFDTANHQLTGSGTVVAFLLTVALWLVCYWSVQLLARVNILLTLFKFGIPVLTVAALMASGFHTSNFSSAGGFAPYGWTAVLTAVSTSGVVFAFNGFQAIVNLGGSAKNPGRAIPAALIGALGLGLLIYLALQVAFIGSVPPDELAAKGWQGVNFDSPFVDLAKVLALHWVVTMLQFGAFISPAGSNIANVASSAYMVQNLADSGFFPKKLKEVHPVYGTARPAMWANLVFSVVLLLAAGKSWSALSAVVSAAMVISYLIGPIAVGLFRQTKPDLKRPFRLPAAAFLCPFTFVLAACALYWSKWPNTGLCILLALISVPIAAVVMHRREPGSLVRQFAPAWWMIAFLLWMAVISALGSPDFGGSGLIPGGVDMALVAVSALGFYYWALNAGRKAARDGLARDCYEEETAPQEDSATKETVVVAS